MLIQNPSIYSKNNFISEEECNHIINISKNKIKQSLVSGPNSGIKSEGRTSKNCWINHNNDNIIQNISIKISKEVNIPIENAEKFQIIYYDENQKYNRHYDSWLFDNTESSIRNTKYGGQRILTALVYLNDVTLGGETKFTKLNYSIYPEKGKLLVFSNVIKNTNIRNFYSEHSGMPVIKGEKWAFNLWFREQNINKLFIYPYINYKIENNDIIHIKQKFLNNNEIINILNYCNFNDINKSSIWINHDNIIKKIANELNYDTNYFEKMCITRYKSNINHNYHLDAYKSDSEYLNKFGQRLTTITIFFTNTKIHFKNLNLNYNFTSGDLIYYNNCLNNSNIRNENMIKNYTNMNELDMIILNIYIREKSKIIDNIYQKKFINFKYNINTPINIVYNTLDKIKIFKYQFDFLQKNNFNKTYKIDEFNPLILDNIINVNIFNIIKEYFNNSIKNNYFQFGDKQSNRYKITNEIITRLLHFEFLPLINKIVGKELYPTYTYFSGYTKNSDLPPHTDRAECEFTCSFILSKPNNARWNIYYHKIKQKEKFKGRYYFIPPKNECFALDCNENSFMIFNGTDHIHYRDKLEYDYYNIILLHYCTKNN